MGRRAVTVPLEHQALMLPGGGTIEITESDDRQPGLIRLAGEPRESSVEIPVVAVLCRQPNRRADPAAVRVVVNGYLVGYLEPKVADSLAPQLDWLLEHHQLYGACAAHITGGSRTLVRATEGQKAGRLQMEGETYSVTLDLAPPEAVREYLAEGGFTRFVFNPEHVPLPEQPPPQATPTPSMAEARLLVFDTETTGLPADWRASYTDVGNWPRLVSIAWAFLDGLGRMSGSRSYIIVPVGFDIPPEASKIHGITTKKARRDGVSLQLALDDFHQCLDWADVVVAHNLEFDEAVTRAEAFRFGRELPFDQRTRFCTMKSTKDLCRIPFASGRGYKYPTLAELHQACFGRAHKRAHNAVGDVDAVVSVVQHLITQGFMQYAPGDPD